MASNDISALKTRLAALSTGIDLDNSPTPVYTYIYIYAHTNELAYKNYMEGARLLAEWLEPLDLATAMEKYPESTNPNFQIHELLTGYESSQLASIIWHHSTRESRLAYSQKQIINLIYFIMRKLITQMY